MKEGENDTATPKKNTPSSTSSSAAAAGAAEEATQQGSSLASSFSTSSLLSSSSFHRRMWGCRCQWRRNKNNNHRQQQSDSSQNNDSKSTGSCCSLQNWIETYFRRPVLQTLMAVSNLSAKYPFTTIAVCIATSILLAVTGYLTNFTVTVDVETSFTPINSYPSQHRDWIYHDSNFPQERTVVMVLHAEGANACARPVTAALDKIFEAVDAIRELPNYSRVCRGGKGNAVSDNGDGDHDDAMGICEMLGVTGFWEDSSEIYRRQVQGNDNIARQAMSADSLSNGIPVAEDLIFGHAVRDNTTGLVEFCQSYTITIRLPETDAAYEFETDVLAAVLELDDVWADEPNNNLRMAINVKRSFEDEALRAIEADLPLIPLVFVIMSFFTTLVFYQRDKIKSRCFLGFCAVCSVLLSLAASYGLLFILGVPVTSLTQLLPFVVFGVGLDDAFILCGEYRRTSPTKTPQERIHDTIQHTGLSITMTSLTSSLAFALGGTSSVQAARWLAMYGFPAIMIDFLYQITFFVACMVLDEQRIANRRRDCCMCIVVPEEEHFDREASWHPQSSDDESQLEPEEFDLELTESIDTRRSETSIPKNFLFGNAAQSSVPLSSSSRRISKDDKETARRHSRQSQSTTFSLDRRVVSAPVMRSAKSIKASSTSIPKRSRSCVVNSFPSVPQPLSKALDRFHETSRYSTRSTPTRAWTSEKWKVTAPVAPQRAMSYDTGAVSRSQSKKRGSMNSAHTETLTAMTVETRGLERISEEKSTHTESSGESGGSNSILASYGSMIHDQLVQNQNSTGCCAALIALSPTAEEGQHQHFGGLDVVSHEELLEEEKNVDSLEILICSSDYEDDDLRTTYDAQGSPRYVLGYSPQHSQNPQTGAHSVGTEPRQSNNLAATNSFWGHLPSRLFDHGAKQVNSKDVNASKTARDNRKQVDGPPPQEMIIVRNHGHAADRFMDWYAHQLLRRPVQVIVIGLFIGLLAVAIQSVTHLKQEFKYTDLVPRDSYLSEYSRVIDEFTTGSTVTTGVYFRHVNVSDPGMQEQMQNYLDDLVEQVPAIESLPEYCWFVHFEQFVDYFADRLVNHTFEEKLDVFLEQDVFRILYSRNIARDEQGQVTASRCFIPIRFDYNSVHSQVDALLDQRQVTREQPINQGSKDWSFFTYIEFYDAWAFYNVVPRELGLVTVAGICSVTAIALLIIPHWTAVLFVFPMITILYIDLLGVMQWGGVPINGTSFVALSMAIGLLVDFIMHVLLSYYEAVGTRQERVVAMLCSMGSSIMLGGISTSLGTLPLAFASSEVFRTIFVVFLGIVTLGLGHGLIFLPVVLAIIGPQETNANLSHQFSDGAVDDKLKRQPSATSSSESDEEENA